MSLFPNYLGPCPCFETRLVENRVWDDETLKKKICMELEFHKNTTIGIKNATIGLHETQL